MLRDFRYALRTLGQSPVFTATAILALALGMGANTAMFTVIRAVLLKPLAYHDPDRLVRISGGATSVRFEEIRKAAQSYTAVGAFRTIPETVTLSGGVEPEVLKQARVSANFLDILGVQPALGRSFLAVEDTPAGAATAMISAELWQRRFAGNPSAIGKTALLGSAPYTIIGVLPQGFQFPAPGVDIWVTRPDYLLGPFSPLLEVFGRVKPGRLEPSAAIAQASAELSVLNRQYNAAHPGMLDGKGGAAERVEPFRNHLVAKVRSLLWMLFGAVAFVLLIACANVASLLLARAASRSREFAVRAALGASRGRLTAQLLVESLLLASAGGALGLLIARSSLAYIAALELPRSAEIRLDYTVFVFASVLSIAAGVLFGVVPMLTTASPNPADVLRASGEGASVFRRKGAYLGGLAAGQMALSLVLLAGATLLMKSIALLSGVHPGFNPSHLLTMQLSLSPSRYDTERKRADFYEQLVRRVQSVRGVRSAAATLTLPFTAFPMTPAQRADQPPLKLNQRPLAMIQYVTPAYFRTMEIPLVRGREFTARDTLGAPRVAIVNEKLARRFWPGEQDPLGQHILVGSAPQPVEVVGISADSHQSLETEPDPAIFRPNAQAPPAAAVLVIRTEGDPPVYTNSVRAQILALDADQPPSNIRTMDAVTQLEGGERKLVLKLLALFAAVALLLTMIGIYGMTAHSVVQGTREIGIRTALGAGRRDILRLVLGRTLAVTLCGIAVGIAGAFALGRAIQALLFHVSATDPATYFSAALLFLLLAFAASYIPARRAARIDPMEALH